MRPARRVLDANIYIELIEARISIGLQSTEKLLQMALGMFPFEIRRVGKPHSGSRGVDGRAIIANISPQRPVLVLLWPGDNTGTGVSSTCNLLAAVA